MELTEFTRIQSNRRISIELYAKTKFYSKSNTGNVDKLKKSENSIACK